MTLSIVFDLDGTLIDSYRDIANALNDVLGSLGMPERDPEVVKTMIGEGVGVLLERGLGSSDPELVERAKKRFRGAYEKRLTETTVPYPGVLAALRALADAGAVLAIATNKPSYFTNPLVAHLGLDRAGIRAAASADEAGARKPDPSVVHLALDRAGLRAASAGEAGTRDPDPRAAPAERSRGASAARLIYVGDMPVDLATARAVPCRFAGVSWGFDPRALSALSPDCWVDTPAALMRLLDS